jgi:hypothetical protein
MYISIFQNGEVKSTSLKTTKKDILYSIRLLRECIYQLILKESDIDLSSNMDYLQEDSHGYSIITI